MVKRITLRLNSAEDSMSTSNRPACPKVMKTKHSLFIILSAERPKLKLGWLENQGPGESKRERKAGDFLQIVSPLIRRRSCMLKGTRIRQGKVLGGCTAFAQIGDDFDDVVIKLNADAGLGTSTMSVKEDSKRAIWRDNFFSWALLLAIGKPCGRLRSFSTDRYGWRSAVHQ